MDELLDKLEEIGKEIENLTEEYINLPLIYKGGGNSLVAKEIAWLEKKISRQRSLRHKKYYQGKLNKLRTQQSGKGEWVRNEEP